MRVYEIPEGSKTAKGRAIQNLINIEQDDKVKAFICTQDLKDDDYINSALCHYGDQTRSSQENVFRAVFSTET